MPNATYRVNAGAEHVQANPPDCVHGRNKRRIRKKTSIRKKHNKQEGRKSWKTNGKKKKKKRTRVFGLMFHVSFSIRAGMSTIVTLHRTRIPLPSDHLLRTYLPRGL